MRGVWSSDFHLGLYTDEVSRTAEIIKVLIFIAKHAVKIKADFVVFGGDIFDNNKPSEFLIAQFIRVLNILRKAGIKTFVMVGNHDAIADSERVSCLSFLKKMKSGYPNVELVDDVKFKMFHDGECGKVYFLFLPYLTKATIPDNYKSVQQYVDSKVRGYYKKLSWPDELFVFSHLNVPAAHPGSEESMLKKVDVHVPDILTKQNILKGVRTTIIQGHIHTKQDIGNIHIVGSPIFANFGEKEDQKFFLQLNIMNQMGEANDPATKKSEKNVLKYIKSPCRPFIEWDIEVKPDAPVGVIEQKQFDKMAAQLTPEAVLKINVTVPESHSEMPWEEIRQGFAKHCHYVKPIKPRILHNRIKRNRKQSIKLDPKKAVRLWVESNKVKKSDKILAIADSYIERLS